MAKVVEEQGINEDPIMMAWSQRGAFPEAFTLNGSEPERRPNADVHADLNPTFNKKERHVRRCCARWSKPATMRGLLDPASLTTAEIDQVNSMKAGQHTFTIFPQYNMAEVNKEDA